MTHPPAVRPFAVAALSVAVLLTVAACAADGRGAPRPSATSPVAARTAVAEPPPAAPPALTEDQARAALITEADLGTPWVPTRGTATWRDELLKATADVPDCGHLLDALYTEDVLGGDAPAPRAVTALDDAYDGAQLHYRVTAHRAADVDRVLARLGALPDTCARFRAVGAGGDVRPVQVTGIPLPDVGDARQGLRVTLSGRTADGGPALLTVDLAAVRVGDDAITLTHGGLGEVSGEATWRAVEAGALRLAEVRRLGRVQV
ncbi:hypothetical protein [Streptomyces sp. NPDC006134]|uniref:hypothetical protein n=1 Tax=Streptomyces sp. NPDC006134 TaxID=3154467 RepID=UPI0033F0A3D3